MVDCTTPLFLRYQAISHRSVRPTLWSSSISQTHNIGDLHGPCHAVLPFSRALEFG